MSWKSLWKSIQRRVHKNPFYAPYVPIIEEEEMKPKVVVIDPGHGGNAKGAVNKEFNVEEKEINLAVAKKLQLYLKLNKAKKIAVYLTRQSDLSLSLGTRCRFANNVKADIFVSIHCNSRPMKGRYGLEIETFFCEGSSKGAVLALKLLEKLIAVPDYQLPTISRGARIGERWKYYRDEQGNKHKKKIQFYVLKHTKMPAALVELGFLCDDEEVELLSRPDIQSIMAIALAKGIVEYLGV